MCFQNRQLLGFCKKRKYSTWNLLPYDLFWEELRSCRFRMSMQEKENIYWMRCEIELNWRWGLKEESVIKEYESAQVSSLHFQREISWWSEVVYKVASSLIIFPSRSPLFILFFFLHKPMWVEVMIQCLCFRIFTMQTHFHINLNLERLFSLMLNCILILEFKTFSETCRIIFHLCLMLRTSYSCAWS